MIKFPECAGCPLYDAPGPVWGTGPDRPRLIYILQNPGQTEVEKGLPAIGPTGSILNRQLWEAGLQRSEIYITNTVKCLTPNNRPPTGREIQHCAVHLEKELANISCDTVILAGDTAASRLRGYSSISPAYEPGTWTRTHGKPWRPTGKYTSVMSRMGTVEQRDNRKWLPTIHPAGILRDPEHKFDSVEHLRKGRLISNVDIALPHVVIDPTDNDVRDAVDHVLTKTHMFTDDVETANSLGEDEEDYVGTDTEVTMCAFGWKPHEAMVLEPRQIGLLAPLYTNNSIWCVEHNGSYDSFFIERYITEPWRAKRFDTMLAAHYHRSYAPKALKGKAGSILSRYTMLPYYGRDIERVDMRLYCGLDGVATYDAAQTLMQVLKNEKLWEVFFKYGMPLLPELEDWRRVGFNIDTRRALVLKLITESKVEEANRRIGTLVRNPLFNWNSDDQVKALLYDEWKLPAQFQKKDKTKLSSDFEARKRLRWEIEKRKRLPEEWKVAREFLLLLDYISGEEKKLEYFERISPDGKIHPFYKGYGAESFRLSSTPNVQNIPVGDITKWQSHGEDVDDPIVGREVHKGIGSIRSIIIPDDPATDWLVSVDFDQIQIWIMAVIFNVKWLLDIFMKGEYLYGVVYEKLFQEAFWPEGVARTKANKSSTVDKSRLRRAKAVPLGFLFGRSANAVSEEYGWHPDEGKVLRSWWFGQCPELEQALSDTKYLVGQESRIRHAFGQLMWYPSGKVTEAINGYAQSNEAMIMIGTILEVAKQFRETGLRAKGVRLMLSVHDSLTANCPQQHVVQAYEEIMKPVLERAIPELNGFKFRHSCEVSKRLDWDDDTPGNEPISFSEWKEKYANLHS